MDWAQYSTIVIPVIVRADFSLDALKLYEGITGTWYSNMVIILTSGTRILLRKLYV